MIHSIGSYSWKVRSLLTCAAEAICNMARVYADVNQHMPKAYWEYDSVNITWGVLENYEVVRKIGARHIVLNRNPLHNLR